MKEYRVEYLAQTSENILFTLEEGLAFCIARGDKGLDTQIYSRLRKGSIVRIETLHGSLRRTCDETHHLDERVELLRSIALKEGKNYRTLWKET